MRDLQGWRARGKCQGLIDLAKNVSELKAAYQKLDRLFFYGSGGSPVKGKRFCSTCPVKNQCRDFAILYEETGLWGATDDKERDMIRKMMPEYVLLLRKEAEAQRRLEIRETVNALGLRAARPYPVTASSGDIDFLEYETDPNQSQFQQEISLYNQGYTETLAEGDWWQTTDYIVYTSSRYTFQDSIEDEEETPLPVQHQPVLPAGQELTEAAVL